MKNNIKISEKMSLDAVIAKYPKTSSVFLKYGFHCIGCPGASLESIEDGAKIHGINKDKLMNELNEIISHEQ